MNIQRVESWVWLLIYGGMGLLGLGLSVQRTNAPLGWAMVVLKVVWGGIRYTWPGCSGVCRPSVSTMPPSLTGQ